MLLETFLGVPVPFYDKKVTKENKDKKKSPIDIAYVRWVSNQPRDTEKQDISVSDTLLVLDVVPNKSMDVWCVCGLLSLLEN